jgi:collagenase-like PrtC family protease
MMDLTIGPNPFFWQAARVRAFYANLAQSEAARVVLGEVVCSKRLPFWQEEIPQAVETLLDTGKDVAITSLGLITLKRERKLTADLMDMGLPVEVNDLSALYYLPKGYSFWVGPLVNVYNDSTLKFLAERGATRVCLPPELPMSAVAELCAVGRDLGVAIEVWGHGRLPLAISGRCYHARLHDRAKDSCQFVCGEDPDGREVETLDDQKFLVVNGVQTLSHTTATVAAQVEELEAIGVASLRLSPQIGDFSGLIERYVGRLSGRLTAAELIAYLNGFEPAMDLSDGFLAGRYGAEWSKGGRTARE